MPGLFTETGTDHEAQFLESFIIIMFLLLLFLVTSLFLLVRLFNQWLSPPLRLKYFPYYVWCSKYSCLCSEPIACFPGVASKYFLKPPLLFRLLEIITGIMLHFRFHILCISIHKLLYFSLLLLLLLNIRFEVFSFLCNYL
jgi:hypothetical protein